MENNYLGIDPNGGIQLSPGVVDVASATKAVEDELREKCGGACTEEQVQKAYTDAGLRTYDRLSPEAKETIRDVTKLFPGIGNVYELTDAMKDGDLVGAIAAATGMSKATVASKLTSKGIQYAAEKFGGKGSSTLDDAGGMSSPKHPLLDDSIPRNGDRLVVNQGNAPTCGHNSCGMVMDTMGKPVDILGLISKTPPGANGITSHQVANILKSEGVGSSAWANRNVDDLARYTANGTPVVVRIADKTGGSGFSHFVVVDGITKRNGVPVVAIRDPWGKQYFSPVSTFKKNFTGEVVVPKGWQK